MAIFLGTNAVVVLYLCFIAILEDPTRMEHIVVNFSCIRINGEVS